MNDPTPEIAEEADAKPPAAARRFLAAFAATWLLALAAMLGFSVYTNPWSNFGPVGLHNRQNARWVKTQHIDALPPDQRPQAYVLGSSVVMRFSGASIERELGLSAFNYGVFWGRAEDDYAIAKHLLDDLGGRPELFILGLDTWAVRPPRDPSVFRGMRRRLLNTPQLAQHIDWANPLTVGWCRLKDCFAQQQLETGWTLLRQGVERAPYPTLAESDYLAIDGTRRRYEDLYVPGGFSKNVFEAVEAGTHPIGSVLGKARDEQNWFMRWNYDFPAFDRVRLDYLRRLVELCHAREVPLLVVFPPVHPTFREVLEAETPYLEHLALLKTWLAEQEARLPGAILGVADMTRLEAFDGDPSGFYDEMHPATRNCDAILKRLRPLLEGSR